MNVDTMKNNCSLLILLKLLSFGICSWGFFTISWRLFKDFSQKATIISSNYVTSADQTILSPSILICNHTAFKSLRISTNLEEYLNDTADPKDIFVDTGFMNQVIVDKIRPIYTAYKGRCFVFEPTIRMKGRKEFLWIRMNLNSSLELSIMEPGEEIYAYADYWPKNPVTVEIKQDTEMADISLKKNVISNNLEKDENSCRVYDQSSYGECISNAFGQYVRNNTAEVYKKCSLPWTMSALGYTKYNSTLLQGCSFDDGIKQNDANIQFFFAAKNYNVSGCKAPCEIPSYEVTARQFRFGSGLLKHSVHGVYPDDRRLKVITITYEYALVHHSEQHRLVNTHNFISQIGGNLGLFLGFSCFSTLLLFYSFVVRCNSNAKEEISGNEIV